jgi:PST family polysaccharide transporter
MLDAFIYILVIERLINVGVLLYLYHKSGESLFRWRFDRTRAWQLVHEGMPLFWAAMAYTVYIRSSELMLMALAGATAVGYYAAANKISSLYLLVPAAMAASAMPIISRSRTENPTVYLTQFTNLLRIGSAIAIFSMVVVTLSANWLMPVLYGDEFAGAGPVLAISLWAVFPITLGVFSGNWVINEGLARIQFEKVLVTAGIVTLLNWLLIPSMGASGAALSMLSASVVAQIVWDFIDPRMRSYNMLKLHSFLPWWFGLDKIKLATTPPGDSQTKVQGELREGELI